ncbi:putative GTP-binding protein EngB [Candidatus Xenohaliotis californiensis]|uniref:Probable GTP-binding protein EngB n=1 Tax=Candidatus Xenohaliotis californiensis TaxID=84677 RepID=A0ABM9N9S5_9RICK|nr:putative GTP-binding protein EngB [Candidatus Xenohaliotis californiensis]
MKKYNGSGGDSFFKINKIKYIKSALNVNDLIYTDLPEVTFLGSSNVGKSSLINALAFKVNIAQTSKTPGKTKTLNLFNAGAKINIVDAPGYGYARLSPKITASWGTMMNNYLSNRPNLLKAFLLINANLGYKKNDIEIINLLLWHSINFQIVVTKKDKLRSTELVKLDDIKKHVDELSQNKIIITSAKNGDGISELRNAISSLVFSAWS